MYLLASHHALGISRLQPCEALAEACRWAVASHPSHLLPTCAPTHQSIPWPTSVTAGCTRQLHTGSIGKPNAHLVDKVNVDSTSAVNAYLTDKVNSSCLVDVGSSRAVKIDLSNAQQAYAQRSTKDLLRAYAVFTACRVQPFVRHADALLDLSKRVLRPSLTKKLVKATFFDHFCAGEDGSSIRPTIDFLRSRGVGSILDYAAEDDVQGDEGPQSRQPGRAEAVSRTYDYESEAKCERHVHTFLQAINTVASFPGPNFAAVKATALGPPALLQRMSSSLLAIRQLFQRFDADGDGFISPAEFDTAYREMFPASSSQEVDHHFNRIDTQQGGHIDYVSWLQRVKLKHTPGIAARLRQQGSPAGSWQYEVGERCLDEAELALTEAMMKRLRVLTQAAADSGVKLMIDAEYTYLQPAIDHIAVELMRQFNVGRPVVFNTYQCYLRDSRQRLMSDMERAQREHHMFAAKLVRGAYLQLERKRAAQMGYPDPIWPTIEDTHKNYDECVEAVLSRVHTGQAELMVASHNTPSVVHTVAVMGTLGLDPQRSGVYFGQLLGMADHLTFNLGSNGYRAYKYVPYGPVDEVMPYLIRRAQENSAMMSGAREEMRMLRGELGRRLRQAVSRG